MRELVVASMVLVMTGCRTQQDQLDHLRAEVTRVTGCGDADVKVFANPYPATASRLATAENAKIKSVGRGQWASVDYEESEDAPF